MRLFLEKVDSNPFWRIYLKIQSALMIIASIGTATLIFTVFFGRNLFSYDIYGNEDFLIIGAMWLYFIGAGYGSYDDSHISADMINSFLKNKKVLKIIDILVYAIGFIVLIVFASWSFKYVAWSLKTGAKTTARKIPLVISQLPLCLGFINMSIYTFYHLLLRIVEYIDPQETDNISRPGIEIDIEKGGC